MTSRPTSVRPGETSQCVQRVVCDTNGVSRESAFRYEQLHTSIPEYIPLTANQVRLSKLRRVIPAVDVAFVSRTTTGLFEQADPSYGEIRYDVGPRHVVGRATTEDAVLEGIFEAADIEPDRDSEPAFMGHPLVTRPTGAALAFYGVWPSIAALAAWLATRQRGPSR